MRLPGSLAFAAVLLLSTNAQAHVNDATELYKANCAFCHGADGEGNTPMGRRLGVKNFHDPDVVRTSDTILFKIAKNGQKGMPAFGEKLSDDQLKELVLYIRTLK